jgi:hypothetical protein
VPVKIIHSQPPREKCHVIERANSPNPPRVTPLELESAVLVERSPPKELPRDQPWPPLDEDPCDEHSTPVSGSEGAAIPGAFGSQLSPRMTAYALPPTTKAPMTRSATWLERIGG